MKKEMEIMFLSKAEKYYNGLSDKIKDKFVVAFTKTKLGYRGDWFEKLKNTDGSIELRTLDESKFYRIFAFWDGSE